MADSAFSSKSVSRARPVLVAAASFLSALAGAQASASVVPALSSTTATESVLLAVASSTATASDSKDTESIRTALIRRLIDKGSPDSLATAAILQQFGQESDTGAYSLLAKAVELAPDRRDLAWLAVRLCDTSAECESAGPERHLREVDPANAAGHLGELSRARRRNDAAGVDAALVGIGHAERLAVYFNPLVVLTTAQSATARHVGVGEPTAQENADAQTQMVGIVAATTLAPLEPISQSCKGIALAIEGRLDKCRRAAAVLARGDTFITEGLGLSLQARLWPEDSAEGRAISAKRRVFQYRLEQYNRLAVVTSNRVDPLAASLELRRSHEREQDSALEYLRTMGVPTEPPPDWRSSQLPRVP
jgi:hypothetical protein